MSASEQTSASKEQERLRWQKAESLVSQIPVVKANFQHIAETGVINGSLLSDLTRLVCQLLGQSGRIAELEEKLRCHPPQQQPDTMQFDPLTKDQKYWFELSQRKPIPKPEWVKDQPDELSKAQERIRQLEEELHSETNKVAYYRDLFDEEHERNNRLAEAMRRINAITHENR